jgi:molybdopterin-guanine dinucleotide biosynthesis protein A
VTSAKEDQKIVGITAVILAGGRNSRFPIPKGLIRINGASIMQRNLSLMRSMFDNVFISTNRPELYFHLGARLLGDVLPSRGPMAGIYTSLINSEDDNVFVTACDMPFPDAGLIRLLCERHLNPGKEGIYDATIPVFNGAAQPLFGIYSRPVIQALEGAIIEDKVTLRRFLDDISVQYVGEPEVMAADPEGKSFININTIEDYEIIMGHEEGLGPAPGGRCFIF